MGKKILLTCIVLIYFALTINSLPTVRKLTSEESFDLNKKTDQVLTLQFVVRDWSVQSKQEKITKVLNLFDKEIKAIEEETQTDLDKPDVIRTQYAVGSQLGIQNLTDPFDIQICNKIVQILALKFHDRIDTNSDLGDEMYAVINGMLNKEIKLLNDHIANKLRSN